MKKAGTSQNSPHHELKPPLWLAMAQLVFAAVLLYVIRNPVSLEGLSTYAKQSESPAIVINIPLSTVAVAAPVKSKTGELPL